MAAAIGTFEIERTVPMNMYSLSKGRCCVISIIAVLLGITVIIVGFLGPPIFLVQVASTNASSVTKKGGKMVYEQTLYSPPFTHFSRHLWFTATGHLTESQASVSQSISINISVVVRALGQSNQSDDFGRSYGAFQRMVFCPTMELCDSIDILRFVKLPSSPFSIDVAISTSVSFSSWAFKVHSFSYEYTNFELWLRVALVFFAFLLICWFMHSMRRFPLSEWNLEQTWTAICLCGLILYNDPLFGYLLIKSYSNGVQWPVVELISYGCRTFYIAILLIFWLAVLHGIRESCRTFCRFYLVKLIVVLPLWALAVTSYGWALFSYTMSPNIDPSEIQRNLSPIIISEGCLFAVFLLMLCYQFLRSCIEVCRMSYLNVRLSYASCLCFGLLVLFAGLCFSTYAVPEWRSLLSDPLLFFYASPFLGLGLPVLINAHAALSACLYGPAVPTSVRSDIAPLVMSAGSDDSDEEIVYDMKTKRTPEFSPSTKKVDKMMKSHKFQK